MIELTAVKEVGVGSDWEMIDENGRVLNPILIPYADVRPGDTFTAEPTGYGWNRIPKAFGSWRKLV
jgi:hypothetical protein